MQNISRIVLFTFWRNLRRSRIILATTGWFAIVLIMSFFPFLVAPYNPNTTFAGNTNVPPSPKFLFGSDYVGRDVLSQVIWGSRTSFFIAFGAVVVELLIALPFGLLAGYFGGVIDQVLMRIADAMLCMPTIVLLIVAVTLFRAQSEVSIILVLGLINWPWLAKTIRGQTLRVREEDYLTAARSLGFGDFYMIRNHVLPNITSPIIVISTFDMAWFILYEATVSFIGLGNPTIPSWGRLLYVGRGFLATAPWVTIFPGIFIMLTVFSINMLGDFLSDMLALKIRR